MSGLQKLLKSYGRMKINGVSWVWDYVKEEAVKEVDMTREEWIASERVKYGIKKPSDER